MNKLFIEYLEQYHGFSGAGYTSSPAIRKRARQYWHRYVAYRQGLGKCLHCNRRHQPTMQRCGVHRKANQAKCLEWARRNRLYIRAQYRARVEEGVCVNNPKHGKVYNGFTKCKKCYFKTKRKTQ